MRPWFSGRTGHFKCPGESSILSGRTANYRKLLARPAPVVAGVFSAVNFKMQVRAGGASGGANIADNFALSDLLAG